MQRREKLGSIFALRKLPLRVQLTALYAGLIVALIAVVLGVSGVLIVRREKGNLHGHVKAASSATGFFATHSFDVGPALVGLVAVLVALVLAWWIAGRFLQPLRTMNKTAQEISATNLHRRLALEGPDDELSELGRTLDDLFGRLEASFESQRHFVANASHELRTPLAAQRTLLQVALADPDADSADLRLVCEEALQLGELQERLVSDLLTLATSEQGIERWEPVDLRAIVGRVVLAQKQTVEAQGIVVETSLREAELKGDPGLIEILISNLMDNALRHNVAGGRVEVSTSMLNGRSTFSIENTGALIPSGEIDRLFRTFQRLSPERIRYRDGHGIGLGIARAIADAHGGELLARPRQEGGLVVEVSFPSTPVDL
jgi:signal transduction histidine kinase